jgi:hypothetical protein
MSTESVRCRDEGHVRVLTLDRPEKKNAFDNALYHELAGQIRKAVGERSVRVLVVTGSGDAFSAGQDMSEMNVEAGAAGGFPALLAALEECDKPIVAAVNGVGVGIGFTMLLHTDVNYMAEGARLRGPFTTLGVVPEAAASFLLPDLVGYQRAEILPQAPRRAAVSAGGGRQPASPRGRPARRPRSRREGRRDRRRRAGVGAPHEAALEGLAQPVGTNARRREDEAFRERLGTPGNVEAIAFFEKRPPD